ncbi:SMP-30/gluconolactonase/LRE family protein [Haliangium sp.]|uniref:SMP-30/gluconolactonase/LRE family protein n=1 Tax=Haliangium sp. TaxID=2663208 RepID=UPI003D14BA47
MSARAAAAASIALALALPACRGGERPDSVGAAPTDHGDDRGPQAVDDRTDRANPAQGRPGAPAAQTELLVPPGTFTDGIEGPAVAADGTLYAVKLAGTHDIARVTPDGRAEVFIELPDGAKGNGIRFDADGAMYIADYEGHRVFKVDPTTKAVTVHAHEPNMNQPNDLAIAGDGTLYASDPDWSASTGQLWRIAGDGTAELLEAGMGTTNGIELSPDDAVLYVNESVQRKVWAYDRAADGSVSNKRLLIEFEDGGLDGMRADRDGNLYITRYGLGEVVKVSPQGARLARVRLRGQNPTNLAFGGPDGRTVYVTVADTGAIERFRAEAPGRHAPGPRPAD